jgi:hypothetical protein
MRSFTTLARSRRRLATAIGLALLHVGVAGAADFCVEYGGVVSLSGPYKATLVAKSYRPPRKGQCKSFGGVKVYSGLDDKATVTGTGCTTSDGTALHLAWTEFHPGSVLFKRIELPLPLGPAGVAYRLDVGALPTTYSIPPVAVPCDPTTTVVH